MKAVKRVKYGEREKKKLEKIVANAEERKKLLDEEHQPQPLGEGDTVLTGGGGGEGKGPDENGSMDIDSKKVEINGKTLRDEHGTYPVWVSSRKIAKIKGKGGKAKNKTTKHV